VIRFGKDLEIPVVVTDHRFFDRIKTILPISSIARVWKEEIYFDIGLEFDGETTTYVSSGSLAYWPPGKALCLFAWANQPYGYVNHVGWFLGPKHYVLQIKDGANVSVDLIDLKIYSRESTRVIEMLHSHGIYVAPRIWRGSESIVGAYIEGNTRVGFEIFLEDFGYIIESDPLYLRNFSILDEAFQHRIRRYGIVKSRIDVNEEGYVIVSSYTKNEDSLPNVIKQIIDDYLRIVNELINIFD